MVEAITTVVDSSGCMLVLSVAASSALVVGSTVISPETISRYENFFIFMNGIPHSMSDEIPPATRPSNWRV